MGGTSRTYLQWREEHNRRGWDKDDPGPFDMERFLMDHGRRVCRNSLVLEPGTVYRGRVIEDAVFDEEGKLRYLCRCRACGDCRWISRYSLPRIPEGSCLHCSPRDANHLKHFKARYPDYEPGSRIGELTVVRSERRQVPGTKRIERMVLVRCSCGAEPHWVLFSNLHSGKTTRCNSCAKRKASGSYVKKYSAYADVCPDPKHRRRLLNRIAACEQRCGNPRCRQYADYGGRGIKCMFASRREYLAYLMSLDGWDNPDLDIDRIDNDGNYEPGNLRFATRTQNVGNRRVVRELQKEIELLRARVRSLECGSEPQVHGKD